MITYKSYSLKRNITVNIHAMLIMKNINELESYELDSFELNIFLLCFDDQADNHLSKQNQ